MASATSLAHAVQMLETLQMLETCLSLFSETEAHPERAVTK